MVNTRSRYNRESRIEQPEIDRHSDVDDDMSVADHYIENNFNDDIENDVRSIERDHEKHRIEQHFLEMNRQIGELTSIVRALTDKITNSREENGKDVLNPGTSTRSDMVTGVSANPLPTPNAQPPRRTPHSHTIHKWETSCQKYNTSEQL